MSRKKPTICPKCGTEAMITEDHVIPQWLMKRLEMFDISIIVVGNKRKLCQSCNSKKAGNIDYKDPDVREFMRAFVDAINKKIK